MARILIIEDNPESLALMTYLLRAFGHTPLSAVDGAEGLAAAARERPELILCDLHLPGVDGYQVARRLREDPDLALIPLVAVTASAMVGDRARGLAAGFDGYVEKPIDPESFVAEIESYLPSSSRGAAAAPGTG